MTHLLRVWHPTLSYFVSTDAVVRHLPSPVEAQAYRLPCIWNPTESQAGSDTFGTQTAAVRQAMIQCQADSGAPVMVYVAKMVAVPKSSLVYACELVVEVRSLAWAGKSYFWLAVVGV
jgi:translation elongation factor EF-G